MATVSPTASDRRSHGAEVRRALATIRSSQFTSGADRSATTHSTTADTPYAAASTSTRRSDDVHSGSSMREASRYTSTPAGTTSANSAAALRYDLRPAAVGLPD